MNNPIRDRLLRQLQNRYVGVFQFDIDAEGTPIIKGVGDQAASSTSAAVKHVRDLGINRIDVFKHGTPWYKMPHSGVSSYEFLSDLANSTPGLTVERIAFDTKAAKRRLEAGQTLANLMEKTYGDSMMLVPDGDTASGLRMKDASGRYLNLEEIQGTLAKSWGIDLRADPNGMGKLFKRMKALMSIQNIEAVFTEGMTVGVYDPVKKYAGTYSMDAALKSTEGIGHLSPWRVEAMAQQYSERAKELRSIYGGTDSQEAYEQLKRAVGLERKAAELQDIADNGGRFNIRMIGANLEETGVGVSDELRGILDTLSAQAKGDVLVPTKRKWLANGWSQNIDMMTSIHSMKQEMRTVGRSVKSHISLRTVHASDEVRTDIQSLTGHSPLFDAEDLAKETSRRVDMTLEALRTTGRVAPDFEAHLRRVVAGVDSYKDVAEGRADISYAKQILNYMDMGEDINTNRSMVEAIHSSVRKWVKKEKPLPGKQKGPHIPGAIRAPITGWEEAQLALEEKLTPLRIGQLTFRERIGWIMNNEAIALGYEPGGGWDLDDKMIAMLRWHEESQTLRMPAYRQPGAAMEIMFYEMDVNDKSAMEYLLRKRGVSDEEIFLTPMDELARRHFPLAGDTSVLEAHSLDKRNIPPMLQFESEMEEAAAKNMAAENEAMKLYEKAMESQSQITSRAQWDAFAHMEKTMIDMPDMGTYYNTRAALDAFMHNNDMYRNAGKSFDIVTKILQQEEVIDAFKQNLKVTTNVVEVAELAQYNMGRMMGLSKLVAENEEDILGMDALIVKERIKDVTSLEAGIKSVNPDWDHTMFLFGEDDPRAHYSNIVKRFDEEAADIAERMSDAAKASLVPDWATDTYFDLSAQQDADFIWKTHVKAEERYSRLAAGIFDEIADLDFYGDLMDSGAGDEVDEIAKQMKQAEVLRAVTTLFEDDGTMGPRAMQAVGAFFQKYVYDNERGRHVFQDGPLRDIDVKVKAHFGLESLREDEMEFLDPKKLATRQKIASEEITSESLLYKYADILGGPELDDVIPETINAERIAKEAEIAAEAAEAVASKPWERITLRGLKNAWDESHHFVKKGALGLLGLTAFSFGYQALKDRSPEDLSGPPLLPGGSAYEDYPISPLPMGGEMFGTPMGSGITYQIKATGNFDHNQFRLQAEAIAGSPASASIYRRGRSLAGESTIFDRIKQNFGQ